MKTRTTFHKKRVLISCFLILLLITFCICLGLGRFSIPIVQVVKIMLNHLTFLEPSVSWTDQMENVIINIRLPRLMGSGLVGGALAISGATYQGIFKNPLVSPDLLGVSTGACVGAAFAILLGFSSLGIQFSALLSGLLVVFITTRIPRLFRNDSASILVLSGIIVSGFMSSLLGFAKYAADPDGQLASIVYWTMGSFATTRMWDVLIVTPAILLSALALILLRWRLNLLSLGEQEAQSLGINIRKTRGFFIFCSTMLTACAVCLCGTIGWIGLIIPHLSRLLIGSDNRYLIPMSAVIGALFLMIVDTMARSISGSEIPLSIITGFLGAPLFIWLLIYQKVMIN